MYIYIKIKFQHFSKDLSLDIATIAVDVTGLSKY